MSDRTPSPEIRKRLYYLLASFAGFITLYIFLFRMELTELIALLYVAASILFIVYFYLSFGFAKTLPQDYDLNPKWSEEKRIKFAERIRRNKERSRSLIYFLLPLMAIMAFDLIYRAFFAS